MSILSSGKDKILGMFLRQRLNDLLQEVGSVESFAIDTSTHTLAIDLALDDEPSSIHIDVRSYKILEEGGEKYLLLGETSVSKKWMETLVRRHIVGKRFALPAEYADIVERLLG